MAVNYKAIAKKLKFEGRAFINGKYVNAIDGKKFETINPATGEKLCAQQVPSTTISKMNNIVSMLFIYRTIKHHFTLYLINC